MTVTKQYEIRSDGGSVWLNDQTGHCLARFGRLGVDVHRSVADQMAGAGECLACTHGWAGAAEWNLFVQAVRAHHDVEIHCSHRPTWLDGMS